MLKQKAMQLTDLSIGYDKHIVLQGLNLEVASGEFLSIFGENGCGKTTLFKGILQLIPLKRGTIKILGNDITTSKDKTWMRSQIGYVPQSYNQGNFPISVFDAVLLGRWGTSFSYFKKPSDLDRKITTVMLDIVDLGHMSNYDCRKLSGGQVQRLNIARALVRSPKILLLDEPTTHLDLESQNKLDVTISNIRKQYDLSIVMITHDQVHARKISDRIVHLRKGRIFNDLGVAI